MLFIVLLKYFFREIMANAEETTESVQEILHQSLNTVGLSDVKMFRREGSTLSVASLPATILTPKPFKSKIPTPLRGSSGRSTPLGGSRTDLSKVPPPVPPKPSLNRKVPLRREISSPPSLENRRGSLDLMKLKGMPLGPKGVGPPSKIPQWKGSTEKICVRGQIRKWESSASLEVSYANGYCCHIIVNIFACF